MTKPVERQHDDQVAMEAMITAVGIAANSMALVERPDPEVLRAIGEIRDALDKLERLMVYLMLDRHNWNEIAEALLVTKQSANRRLSRASTAEAAAAQRRSIKQQLETWQRAVNSIAAASADIAELNTSPGLARRGKRLAALGWNLDEMTWYWRE